MGLQPVSTPYPWTHHFGEVIDVRSPAEFQLDHIPGAINLPVLDNAQRANVGTLYQQVSPFEARKLGAALVSENLSKHLKTHFLDKPKDYHPVVYCWRGGQRSQSMAVVLTQIGWRTHVLTGGYQTYRTAVRKELDYLPLGLNFKVLCGLTGTAKTKILTQLQQVKAQVLDLEMLANHRGSVLGGQVDAPQPSQKGFESTLLIYLQQFDPLQPIWVEAESNKIGQIFIPPVLWKQLKASPCIEIKAPITSRVHYLLATYEHFSKDLESLRQKVHNLKSRYGKAQIAHWDHQIAHRQLFEFVTSLLEIHYDPAYRRSMKHQYLNRIGSIDLPDLSPDCLNDAVEYLIGISSPTM